MEKPYKSWLITGGCGFIGVNLINKLLKDNDDIHIRVLDNLSVGTREDLSSQCDLIEIKPDECKKDLSFPIHGHSAVELVVDDIKNYKACLFCCRGIDIVVHLAANTGVAQSVENPQTDMETNVVGTFNLLKAAKQNKVLKFIFASSGAPIGECNPPIHEEIAPHPVSPYGASKLAGEGYCSAYYRTYGLETVCLRFGNVYGPGSKYKSSVVAKFIKQAISGDVLEIYGDGNQTRDFVYIDDLVQAIWRAAKTKGIGGETFQIATNRETTVNEIINIFLPILAAYGYDNIKVKNIAPRIGDVRQNYSDTSKAQLKLAWKSRTSLTMGLENTVKWFLNSAGKQ